MYTMRYKNYSTFFALAIGLRQEFQHMNEQQGLEWLQYETVYILHLHCRKMNEVTKIGGTSAVYFRQPSFGKKCQIEDLGTFYTIIV